MRAITQLHLVDLERSSAALLDAETRYPRLSTDDEARITAMSGADARRERHLSAIALRLVLARVAGDGRYDRVAFIRTSSGKPLIAGAPVSFSLSHSSGWALIAAVPQADALLGIDLQAVALLRMPVERRTRMLAAGARLGAERLSNPAAPDDAAAVIEAWVRIEAVAKASGLGLAHVLARLGIIAASAAGPEASEADARFEALVSRLTIKGLDIESRTGSAMRAALAFGCELQAPAATPAVLPADAAGLARFVAGEPDHS